MSVHVIQHFSLSADTWHVNQLVLLLSSSLPSAEKHLLMLLLIIIVFQVHFYLY